MKAAIRQVADSVAKRARGVSNDLRSYEGIIPDESSNGRFKK